MTDEIYEELTLTPEKIKKLREYTRSMLAFRTDMQIIKDSMKDLTEALSEELNIEKKILNQVIVAAEKRDVEEKTRALDTVGAILEAIGR